MRFSYTVEIENWTIRKSKEIEWIWRSFYFPAKSQYLTIDITSQSGGRLSSGMDASKLEILFGEKEMKLNVCLVSQISLAYR